MPDSNQKKPVISDKLYQAYLNSISNNTRVSDDMPMPYPPGIFQKDPVIFGDSTGKLANAYRGIVDRIPQLGGETKKIQMGLSGDFLDLMNSPNATPRIRNYTPEEKLNALPNLNIRGITDTTNNNVSINPGEKDQNLLHTLMHELMHTHGYSENTTSNFDGMSGDLRFRKPIK